MSTDRDGLRARLRSLFEGELDDAVRALNAGLVRLEETVAVGEGAPLVGELFRLAHGIKGAAQSAGVPEAVEVAHRLEDALAELRAQPAAVDAGRVAALLADVDGLADIHRRLTDRPPAPTPGAAAPPGEAAAEPEEVRVGSEKIADLVHHTSNLASVAHRLDAVLGELAGAVDWRRGGDVDLGEVARLSEVASRASAELARVTGEIRYGARSLGFQPFAEACSGLDRVARDVASASGKSVRLTVEGGELEVDRRVVAALREPLLHVVRNAVDHGIEHPRDREASGKNPIGHIAIGAELRSGRLEVSVTDDGAGVDQAALRAAAGELEEDGGDDDLTLAFRAGLSTAAAVSAVSGRGIGLDAVRDRIESIGGDVRLESTTGRGTAVRMVSPISLSLAELLVVRAGGELLGVALGVVRRVLRVETSDLRHLEGGPSLLLDEEIVPVVPLLAAAGFAGSAPIESGTLQLVVLEVGGAKAALAVDAVVSQQTATVRSLPSRAEGLRAVLGVAALADGEHALVLNPSACVAGIRDVARRPIAAPAAPVAPRILLAEDTATTRALERSILEAAGYDVVAAVDGADAWQLLQRHGADAVVTDVHMPRTDGIELCRLIRASDRFAELPVVLISSLGSDDDRRRGADAGANAYIVKADFDQQTMLQILDRLL